MKKLIIAVIILLLSPFSVMAATIFNDTTADHKWSTVANWSDGKPDAADAVTIGTAVTALEIDEAATCLSFNATGLTGNCTISGTGTLAVAGAFTLEAGTTWSATGEITFTLDADVTLNFAGKTMPVVNINYAPTAARAQTITPGAGASFVQLNIDLTADRRDLSVAFTTDFSVSQSSSWLGGGDATYRPLIKSSVPGTGTRTVTVSAASQTLTMTDVDLQDIKVADTNSPTVSLTRVGDCGGNTATTGGGYIKDVSDPKTVYLDAGFVTACNYYSNYWSTQVGTPERDGSELSLNHYPLPQDTAIVDDYTWDSTGRYLILSNSMRIGNIDASTLTEANAVTLGNGATIYGDLNIASGKSVITNTTTDTYDSRVRQEASASQIITLPNLVTNYGYRININSPISSAVFKLGADVNMSAANAGTFTLTSGTVDLNGKVLTVDKFSSSNTNTRSLIDSAGGGKIVVNALTGTVFDMSTATGLTVSNAPDIEIGDSNNTQTADVTFAGGGQTFGDFKVTKHAGDFDCIITGSNTFGSMTLETPDATYQYSDLKLTAGTDQTITSLVVDGTADYQINILSATPDTPAVLSDTTGTNALTYCTVTDITAEGGATWNVLTADGNVDGGGTTGWTWTVGGRKRLIITK